VAKLASEQGNVVIEFVGTAVALFIPIAYIAIATLQIATGYIEVQNAARSGARVFVSSSNENLARVESLRVINLFKKTDEVFVTKITCSTNPCLLTDTFVTVEVAKQIKLDLPEFLGIHNVTVSGLQVEVVQESR